MSFALTLRLSFRPDLASFLILEITAIPLSIHVWISHNLATLIFTPALLILISWFSCGCLKFVLRMLEDTGKAFEDPSAMMTQMREDSRLLEFATFNDLVLANTWHSSNEQRHKQINYILVRKRFRSGVNIARTRSFPGADIRSDHTLLMMTFRLRLKRISKPKHTRLKFDLEKLKDPNVLETFQTMIGGRFAPLTVMSNKDTDTDSMITTFNTAVTETASEILGKHRQKKKPWITADILHLCDKRRELKKK